DLDPRRKIAGTRSAWRLPLRDDGSGLVRRFATSLHIRCHARSICGVLGSSTPRRNEPMEPRLNALTEAPEAIKAMLALEGYLRHSGISERIYWLVKIRASQIN